MRIVFFRILKLFFITFFAFLTDFFRALILQKCIGSMYLLPATPPTVLGQFFSNFTGAFRMVWRYAYCFFQNPEIIFDYIFCIFNLDFFRALILQKCIGSMYLVRATPPTFSGRSFWNFTHAFRMVWRYAYCFFRILKLFFITFYCIFNLDLLVFFFFFFFLELWNNCLLLLFMFNLDCFQPLYYRSA